MRSNLPLAAALLMACAMAMSGLTGCAGYRLGSMLPPDVKTIAVPTFVNKTKEPSLEVETTSAAIEEFQKDGSLRIADADEADAVLSVTIIKFATDPVSFQRNQSTAAKEYRMTITVSFTMKRRSDNTIIAQADAVSGDSTFELLGNMSSSKAQALPATAKKLAHEIVGRVVETWN